MANVVISLTWCIWYHRNKIVFSFESFNGQKMMEDAIFFCWIWLKYMEKGFDIPFHSWASNVTVGFFNQGEMFYSLIFLEGCLH